MNNPKWTHKGLMYGVVPVFLNMDDPVAPEIGARNWLCEILFDTIDFLFGLYCWTATMLDPDFEPQFFFKLTGEIASEDD